MNEYDIYKGIQTINTIRLTPEDKAGMWERLSKLPPNDGNEGGNSLLSKVYVRPVRLTTRWLVQNLGLLTLSSLILIIVFVNPGLDTNAVPRISPVIRTVPTINLEPVKKTKLVQPDSQEIAAPVTEPATPSETSSPTETTP